MITKQRLLGRPPHCRSWETRMKRYTNTRVGGADKVRMWNPTPTLNLSCVIICHVSPLSATLKRLKLLDAAKMRVCTSQHHSSWLHQTASVVQDSDWQLQQSPVINKLPPNGNYSRCSALALVLLVPVLPFISVHIPFHALYIIFYLYSSCNIVRMSQWNKRLLTYLLIFISCNFYTIDFRQIICSSTTGCQLSLTGCQMPPSATPWHHPCLWIGPTVFRSKLCKLPRCCLPNSAANRGKFLEFRDSPRPPILEYTVPTLAQLCPKTSALLSHQTIKQKFYT